MDSRRGDSQETARETEVRALKKLHDWISLTKHLRLPAPRQMGTPGQGLADPVWDVGAGARAGSSTVLRVTVLTGQNGKPLSASPRRLATL
jgi:hypothetical protein